MATLKEVAEKAGVTVTTVSRMLNSPQKVSKQTRDKIQRVMRELDYQPNELARSLSKQTSHFIGLIVPTTKNYFFCKVVDTIEHYTAEYGYKLLLCNSNHEKKKEIEYFTMLKAHKVAGVIIASRTQDIAQNISLQSPIISIDRTISKAIPSVCADNFTGGYLAGKHLIEKGCRRLAYFSGSPMLSDMYANQRLDGFESAIRQNGLCAPVVTELSEEQFVTLEYEEVIAGFMAQHHEVDGIFTSNDIIAAQIIQHCAKRGIHVPNALKIVGYDDIDLARLYTPSITTIRQPIDAICRFAVDCIVHFQSDRELPINTTFPVELIEREST